jgi:hypothetical protein
LNLKAGITMGRSRSPKGAREARLLLCLLQIQYSRSPQTEDGWRMQVEVGGDVEDWICNRVVYNAETQEIEKGVMCM